MRRIHDEQKTKMFNKERISITDLLFLLLQVPIWLSMALLLLIYLNVYLGYQLVG